MRWNFTFVGGFWQGFEVGTMLLGFGCNKLFNFYDILQRNALGGIIGGRI